MDSNNNRAEAGSPITFVHSRQIPVTDGWQHLGRCLDKLHTAIFRQKAQLDQQIANL